MPHGLHNNQSNPPEYNQSVRYPSYSSGLEPLAPGTQLAIAEFANPNHRNFPGEVLTIVAGEGSAVDEAGLALPYDSDAYVQTAIILDVSASDVVASAPDPDAPEGFRWVKLNYGFFMYDLVEGGRHAREVAKFRPLYPGVRHKITTRAGRLVGSMSIQDDTLLIAREDTPESENSHMRVVGASSSHTKYVRRPAITRLPSSYALPEDANLHRGAMYLPDDYVYGDIMVTSGELEDITDPQTRANLTPLLLDNIRVRGVTQGHRAREVVDRLRDRQYLLEMDAQAAGSVALGSAEG